MTRLIGLLLLVLGILAAIGQEYNLAIPTARWFFNVSRDLPWLHFRTGPGAEPVLWFGWLSVGILVLGGLWIRSRCAGYAGFAKFAAAIGR